jgi:hypothetical protein
LCDAKNEAMAASMDSATEGAAVEAGSAMWWTLGSGRWLLTTRKSDFGCLKTNSD